MRVIAFRVRGDFAHFRRYYTTSSPLSFSIPPPSAIRGLIGAILGLSRNKYPGILSTNFSKVGVRLLSPVKKIRLALNYIDTKDGAWVSRPPSRGRFHTQVRIEFIKDPDYEIYFHHKDKGLMDKFSQMLKAERTVYTPYLGITECIAKVFYLWDEEVKPVKGVSEIVSAFKKSSLISLHLKEGTGIIVERVPIHIGEDRIHTSSDEVVFSPYAGVILAEVKETLEHPVEEGKAFTLIG